MPPIKILGIAGSLRQESLNKMALNACNKLLPTSVATMTIFDIKDLPLMNQDTEKVANPHVAEFKAAIRAADMILIATPEYNYSVPGVLKNAIDVASRPYGDNAWNGKVVATISASIGIFGGVKSQLALKPVYGFVGMIPAPGPEVCIGEAPKKFDAKTKELIHKPTEDFIKSYLEGVCLFTKQLQEGRRNISKL